MNANTPANGPAPAAPKYKHALTAELVGMLKTNLLTNNANPDALDAAKDARELANTPEANTAAPVASPLPSNTPAAAMVKEIITDYDEWLADKDERELEYMLLKEKEEAAESPPEAR